MSQDHDSKDLSKDLLRDTETVSSLLEQNDDLMARITAFAKKTSGLEKRLAESDFSKKEMTRKLEILGEQLLVLREKDKIQKGRLDAIEKKARSLISERDFQELRYAEIHQKNLDLQKKREATNRILTSKISRLSRYKDWVQTHLYSSHRSTKEQTSHLRTKIEELYLALTKSEEARREEKANSEQLQESFEQQLQEYREDAKNYTEAQDKYLQLKEERTVLQNRVISAERIKDDLQTRHKKEVVEWQEKVSSFRQEAKGLKLENQHLNEENLQLQEENKKLHRQAEKLRDQNESVQELWNDNRKRLERSLEKESALQKLNQELSLQLKESRKSIEKTKVALSENKIETEKKFKKLKMEFDNSESRNTNEEPEKKTRPAVEKLETLLAEIQSGYTQTIVAGQLANHRFASDTQLMSEEGDLEL